MEIEEVKKKRRVIRRKKENNNDMTESNGIEIQKKRKMIKKKKEDNENNENNEYDISNKIKHFNPYPEITSEDFDEEIYKKKNLEILKLKNRKYMMIPLAPQVNFHYLLFNLLLKIIFQWILLIMVY
jgi:hypothetical protein